MSVLKLHVFNCCPTGAWWPWVTSGLLGDGRLGTSWWCRQHSKWRRSYWCSVGPETHDASRRKCKVFFLCFFTYRNVTSQAARYRPCVNGDCLCQMEMTIFSPPQNRHTSTDHQKICHRWQRRRTLRLCQINCISVHGGFWAHGWNITKIIFIYALFFRNSPTGQTRRPIFTHDGLNDADPHKDVPFWDFFTLLPI